MSRAVAKYAKMTEDEQFRAVAWGDKPMCNIDQKHETSLPCIEFDTVVHYKIGGKASSYSYPSYLYYKPGLYEKALIAVALLVKREMTPQDHRVLGSLLGYDKAEIEAWVKAHEALSSEKGLEGQNEPMPNKLKKGEADG